MITIQGVDNPQYQTASAPGKDDWDHFNSDRDHVIRDAESWRHANHYYTGSQDLDAYGRWEEIPDYGSVWVPAAGPDWAPYRSGRWVWEPYYGWTWVSDYEWGSIPFHYGRWVDDPDRGWLWLPGYVWGPGWVAWRHAPGWVGWAPLPAQVVVRPGIEISAGDIDVHIEPSAFCLTASQASAF